MAIFDEKIERFLTKILRLESPESCATGTAQHQNTTECTLIQRSSIGHPPLRKQTSQKLSDHWKPDKQNSRFARHIHSLFSRAILS